MTKYAEIVNTLRREIVFGEYRANQQLPSEAEMGERFGASRGTVRKAIDVLRAEHLVHARRGSGTFVSATSPISSFFSLSTFEQDMRAVGRVPSTRLLRAEESPATTAEAERLGLDVGDPVIHVASLRLADDVPVAHEYRVFAAGLCPGILDEDLEHRSMYWLLTEKYAVPLIRIEHVVDLRPLIREEASLLEVPAGSPGYVIDRLTSTTDLRPAVWFRSIHLNTEGASR